jgi:hypothetical protein
MAVQTEPEHSFEAIPIKPMEGSTKIKTAIEMIKYVPEHGLDLDCVMTLITEKKFNQLPDPLALRSDIPVPFTMQMVFRKLNDKEYQILRHFTYDQKLDVRLLKSAVSGDLYLLDYGKKFRTGQAGCQLLLEKGLPKLKRNSLSGFSKQNKNVLEPTLLHHPLSRLCRTSQRFWQSRIRRLMPSQCPNFIKVIRKPRKQPTKKPRKQFRRLTQILRNPRKQPRRLSQIHHPHLRLLHPHPSGSFETHELSYGK